MTTMLIPVHGTWSMREKMPWWKKGSQFHAQCVANGFDYIEPEFFWSGHVNGIGFASLIGRKTEDNDWDAGAAALGYYMRWIDYPDRNLVCHSHGLQLAIRCKTPIRSVVSVGSPIRKETDNKEDRAHIGYWLHVHELGFDKFQFLGGIGDNRFGYSKCATHADNNAMIKGIHHSKVLSQKEMELWVKNGWYDAIKGAPNGTESTLRGPNKSTCKNDSQDAHGHH